MKASLPVLLFLVVAAIARGAAPDTVEAARLALRTKEFAQAVRLLTQAAQQNSPDAQYLLGLAQWNGVGIPANRDAARDSLRRAAEGGHAASAHALAALLARGTPAERAESATWLARAAAAGYTPAVSLRDAHGLPMADARATTGLAPALAFEIARYAVRHDDSALLAALGPAAVAGLRDEFGRTLLFVAAESGAADAARQLLGAGADVNAVDEYHGSALMIAATQPDPALTRLLLSAGARVDAVDLAGRSALFRAAAADRAEQVAVLLKAGAGKDLADLQNWTVLDVALQNTAGAAAETLRAAGAKATPNAAAAARGPVSIDPARPGVLYQGWPPLLVAVARNEFADVRKRLAEGAPIDALTPQGESALQVAIEARAHETLQVLLALGANARRKDRDGSNALERAIASGDAAAFTALTEAGVSPGDASESSRLLNIAVCRGDMPMVRALLARGASAAAPDAGGMRPLMHAARLGDAELVKLLLDRGAAAAAVDKRGRSALWYAAAAGSLPAVDVLLAMQLRADVPDRDGATPLLAAIRAGADTVVARMLKEGAAADAPAPGQQPPLSIAAGLGHAAIVDALLAHRADVDATDGFGDTALMAAARAGNTALCVRLLTAGANPRLRNRERATAAELAETRGFASLAARLRG